MTTSDRVAPQRDSKLDVGEALVEQQVRNIRAVVFTELKLNEREPGVVVHKKELDGMHYVTLCNRIMMGGSDEWRCAPAHFAALVLVYEGHKARAEFLLPPQFRL